MKNFIYLILIYTVFITKSEAQIPESGLIAYYPFNGNADDHSGNCNNGFVYGAILTTDRFNNQDAAYQFNNSSYIEIPASNFENQEYSYSAWANTDNIPAFGDGGFIISVGGDDFRDQSMALRYDTYGSASYNDDLSVFVLYGQKPTNIGQWQHIVTSRSNDKVQLYVDGHLIDEEKVSNFLLPLYTPNLTATIGIRHIYTQPFYGKIDDVRIYNRALTPEEVLALYNEHLCYQNLNVTDTLYIQSNITSFSPINFQINIKVYPNPGLDHLIIDAGDISILSGYTIRITDASGVKVFQTNIDQQFYNLDMNKWKGKGLYFLYLYDSNSNIVDIKISYFNKLV